MVLKMGLEPTWIATGDFASDLNAENHQKPQFYACFLAFSTHFYTVCHNFFQTGCGMDVAENSRITSLHTNV